MARQLSTQEKLINKAARYSKLRLKNNPLYLGGTEKKGFFNWNRDTSKLYVNVYSDIAALNNGSKTLYKGHDAEVSAITKEIISALSSLPFADFSREQLKSIADFRSGLGVLLNTISVEESKTLSAKADESSIDALKTYRDAINHTQSYYKEIGKSKTFNANTYANIINGIDLNAIHENDVALVRAFSFIGSPLKMENGKWVYDEIASQNSKNGLRYKDSTGRETIYKLPESNVKAFVDGYLNKPINERNGKVISPNGLFRFYSESIASNEQVVGKVDKATIEAKVSEAKLRFSTDNNPVWQSYLVADELSARRDATRLALADVFESQFADLDNPEIAPYSNDLIAQIDGNQKVKGNMLDQLYETAYDSHKDIYEKMSDDHFGLGSIDDIVEKYKAENAKLSTHMAVAGDNKDVVQARINEITHSIATVIAIREMQTGILEGILNDFEMTHDNSLSDKSIDEERFKLIQETTKNLGTMDFVQVVENHGVWSMELDESKVPAQYKAQVQKSYDDIKGKINNIITYKTIQDSNHDINYELSEEEQLRLSTEDIFDICWNVIDPTNSNLHQTLADEATMDRLVALLEGPDNPLKKKFEEVCSKTASPDLSELMKELEAVDDTLGLFVLDDDVLKRYYEGGDIQNTANRNLRKNYVIMDRIGKAINTDPAILRAIDEHGIDSDVVRPMINNLYKHFNDTYDKNPPSEAEEKRAKEKFDILSKKKNNEFIKNFTIKDGEPPVNLIEAIKDPTIRNILLNRDKQIDQAYINQLEQEKQNHLDGEDPDQEIDEENKKKLKPYTFKEKFGKKDGSAILKKLKPYCKKTSEKIVDGILKMIDKTVIIPKDPNAVIKNKNNNVDDNTIDDTINDNEDGNIIDDSTDEMKNGKEVHYHDHISDDTSNKVEEDKKDNSTEEELEQLKAEIEKRGKYAYLASGRILNQSITDKNIEWQREGSAFDGTELESIESLIQVLGFIGSPENNVNEAKLKLALLDLIEARASSAQDAEICDRVAKLCDGISGELREAIETIVTTPDLIHFVWAMELSSELSSEEGKLKLGSKLGAGTIQQIKDNPHLVDNILRQSGHFDKHIIQEASKIWADAIYVDKTNEVSEEKVDNVEPKDGKIDLSFILDSVAKTNEVPNEYIQEARDMNARVDEYMARKKKEEQQREEEILKENEEAEWATLLAKDDSTIITGADGIRREDVHKHYMVEKAKELIKAQRQHFTLQQAKDFIQEIKDKNLSTDLINTRFNQIIEKSKENDGM